MLLGAAVAVGFAGIACSAMIYVATGRPWWNAAETFSRFGATTAVAAFGTLTTTATIDAGQQPLAIGAAIAVAAVVGARLLHESQVFASDDPDETRTARLLRTVLASTYQQRRFLSVAGAGFALLGAVVAAATLVVVGLALLAIGETWERRLFFAACAPRTMPGGLR